MQTQASGRHDSVPFMPEVLKPLRQNTSEPQRRSRQISNPMQQKGQKRHKNLRQAKIRGGSEVECCLYETSMSLSNSRPHPSFVVCRKVLGRDGDLKMEVKNTVIVVLSIGEKITFKWKMRIIGLKSGYNKITSLIRR